MILLISGLKNILPVNEVATSYLLLHLDPNPGVLSNKQSQIRRYVLKPCYPGPVLGAV
jgi:hypothetical protein